MPRIEWHKTGENKYETGVKMGVLYPQVNGKYPKGVPWNGLSAVTESPSGAEASPVYADDIKYLNLLSVEEFGATVEAYMYPDEFEACQGYAEIAPGITIGQQEHQAFGLCYRTTIGNDTERNNHGYKLHLIYGATAAPSERNYQSINDSPEPMTMSWELTTVPVAVAGKNPTASLTLDSTKTDAAVMKALEDVLYGSEEKEASLPLPDEIVAILAAAAQAQAAAANADPDNTEGDETQQ